MGLIIPVYLRVSGEGDFAFMLTLFGTPITMMSLVFREKGNNVGFVGLGNASFGN